MAAFLVFSETNKILWFSHNKNIFRICKQKCMKTVCGCTHFFFVSPVNNGSNYEKNKEKNRATASNRAVNAWFF